MMKQAIVLGGLALSFLMTTGLSHAQTDRPSTGMTFKLGFWNMGDQSEFLTYIREDGREYIETGGLGGWLTFTSRTSDFYTFEFNLGAFGRAEGYESSRHFDFDDDVDGTAVIPVLFGIQREFLSVNNSSDLRPYLSAGIGPYWITDVKDEQSLNREEVRSKIDPGMYLGGGLNFFLSDKFALNFDGKYHIVDFNMDNDVSGLELGIGFSILWGKYKPQNGR